MKRKNPVAKFSHRFNMAKIEKNKKKQLKKGYRKHKGTWTIALLSSFYCLCALIASPVAKNRLTHDSKTCSIL